MIAYSMLGWDTHATRTMQSNAARRRKMGILFDRYAVPQEGQDSHPHENLDVLILTTYHEHIQHTQYI
jgi:hypothetical protein